MKCLKIVVLVSCLMLNYGIEAQIGWLAYSPVQTIEQKIAKTDITIVYSRPAMRDREIFGGLVPFDQLWRTGANRNTKLTTSEDLIIGDTRLDKGTYAIFTKPGKESWELFFYTATDNWDVPAIWDTTKIAAHMIAQPQGQDRVAQSMTISIDNMTNEKFDLGISWDRTYVPFTIGLTTEATMTAAIEDVLDGPNSDDYYSAAKYRLESGRKLQKAMDWINQAIELREEPSWWDNRMKSWIYTAMERDSEALLEARSGLKQAQSEGSEYGIAQMTKIVGDLQK